MIYRYMCTFYLGVRLAMHSANRLVREDGQLALIAACAAGGQVIIQILIVTYYILLYWLYLHVDQFMHNIFALLLYNNRYKFIFKSCKCSMIFFPGNS